MTNHNPVRFRDWDRFFLLDDTIIQIRLYELTWGAFTYLVFNPFELNPGVSSPPRCGWCVQVRIKAA